MEMQQIHNFLISDVTILTKKLKIPSAIVKDRIDLTTEREIETDTARNPIVTKDNLVEQSSNLVSSGKAQINLNLVIVSEFIYYY